MPSPPDRIFTNSELADLLEKAKALGFSLERDGELEQLTVRELEVLVNRKM